MSSKVLLYLGVLVTLLLWFSSDVAVGNRDETSTKTIDAKNVTEEVEGLNEEKYPGGRYGGYPGGRYGGYPGGGYGGYPGRGYPGYRGRGGYPGRGRYRSGYCRHGCCGWGYQGRHCRRCCSYAGEAVDKAPQDKPQN